MAIRAFLADDHTVVRDGVRMLLEVQGDIEVVGDAAHGTFSARSTPARAVFCSKSLLAQR